MKRYFLLNQATCPIQSQSCDVCKLCVVPSLAICLKVFFCPPSQKSQESSKKNWSWWKCKNKNMDYQINSIKFFLLVPNYFLNDLVCIWHVTGDRWHVTRDTWHMTGGEYSLKCPIPNSNGLEFIGFWRFGGKGLLTESLTKSF